MNAKKLVKATNIIGMVAVTLLVYWVFALILIQVFGLKVFREHITEIFLMSILGIFAVMGGTLMLNIMLNLTRIAATSVRTCRPTCRNTQPRHPAHHDCSRRIGRVD